MPESAPVVVTFNVAALTTPPNKPTMGRNTNRIKRNLFASVFADLADSLIIIYNNTYSYACPVVVRAVAITVTFSGRRTHTVYVPPVVFENVFEEYNVSE